jgi:hypothetical protein
MEVPMAAVTSVQNATTGPAALQLQQAQAQQAQQNEGAKQHQSIHHPTQRSQAAQPPTAVQVAPSLSADGKVGQNVDTKA